MTGYAVEQTEKRRRFRRRSSLWLVGPSFVAAGLTLLPLVYLVIRALGRGFSGYAAVIFTSEVLRLLWRTTILAAAVVAVCIAIALPLAWLLTRTDLPGRRVIAVVANLPLVIPSYLGAYVVIASLGPRGALQKALAPFGIEELPSLVYGFDGALLVLAMFSFPYLLLPLIASFRTLDPSLEEASRILGLGRRETFIRIVLPQLRTPLLKGSLLIALYTLSDFGAVSLTRYDTFTVAIYTSFRSMLDRTAAAALSTVLVLLTLLLLFVESRVRSRFAFRVGSSRPYSRVRLGKWRIPSLLLVSLFLAVTVIFPLATILGWLTETDLRLSIETTLRAAAGSLDVSFRAAIACVLLSIPLGLWVARSAARETQLVEATVMSGYALPGLVTALALVFFATRVAPPLYQTTTLLVIAYVIRFLPEALAAAVAAITPISRSFEEAARILGRSQLGALVAVVWPLSRRGVLAGGGLVFLTAAKELPATLILRPTGFETLATRIWSLTAEASYAEAAFPALLLVAVSAIPIYFLVIRPALSEAEVS